MFLPGSVLATRAGMATKPGRQYGRRTNMALNDGEHAVTSFFGIPLPSSTGAAGSDGTQAGQEDPSAHAVLGTVTVTIPGNSSQVANPSVTVTAEAVNVPSQVPSKEPFTGVANTWETTPGHDDPSGHVSTPNHVNSLGTGAGTR